MTTTALFEFMKARIAEDVADHYPYREGDMTYSPLDVRYGCVECGIETDAQCRTQREAQAKLSIVQYTEALWFERKRDVDTAARYRSMMWTVQRLADVYSDHPDHYNKVVAV